MSPAISWEWKSVGVDPPLTMPGSMPAARRSARIPAHEGGELGEACRPDSSSALDVSGVEGDAGEAQVGEFLDGLRELHERLAGRDADAAEARIHFGKDADFHLRGARGVGELPGGERCCPGLPVIGCRGRSG